MLYIRHAQKLYRNGHHHEFSLDPGLTDSGRESAKVKFAQLIQIYGIPSLIISSPYLRTRETANIARDIIYEQTHILIEIIYDPAIGEYLGHQTHRDLQQSLHPDTIIHNPIPPEQWKQYSARISKHIKTSTQSSVWYITHGLVIQSVAFFHGRKIPHPNELEGICIRNATVEII
jgi:broad specificity phosphatase PhoE